MIRDADDRESGQRRSNDPISQIPRLDLRHLATKFAVTRIRTSTAVQFK